MSAPTPQSPGARPPGRGRPGRYPRTFGGLVASMLVLVVAVVLFVGVRDFFRPTPSVEVQPVDADPWVQLAEDDGFVALRPADLPDGWVVSTVRYSAQSDDPQSAEWSLGAVIDDERFVGVKVLAAGVDDALADTLGDGTADQVLEQDAVEVSGARTAALDGTWSGWRESPDDAITLQVDAVDLGVEDAEVDQLTVIVYGSVGADVLEEFASGLVAE